MSRKRRRQKKKGENGNIYKTALLVLWEPQQESQEFLVKMMKEFFNPISS
ncbi:hypothetical protein CHY_2636 [Carboxydothermus hydrogenoformans Z-2901]|uniref:Uncharacterized protein n=1 Tax=Carboxydothermus hydrogenoformans (strain ATCC BAA-161 / DSM 6008 / Z-2901) TaxID=246194 RepID=Q3A8V6_CARHZ|nr:hypothetical protein CHY_2636 [Carboxydothermus hydrogenoformans Z-2901]